jgi:glycosyltransferase involved in cell wall biosynthesis
MHMPKDDPSPEHLAIFIPSLAGGGVARVMLNLAEAFVAQDHQVDIVVCQPAGPYLPRIQPPIRLVVLRSSPRWQSLIQAVRADPNSLAAMLLPVFLPFKPPKTLRCLPDLVNYLRNDKPSAVLAGKTHTNLIALWAWRNAAVATRLAISEHTTLSTTIKISKKWRWRFVAPLIRRIYPWANAIVAVSDGVADDLSRRTGISRKSITTIYNPVLISKIVEKARIALDDPWFAPGAPPVILGIGRLVPQKDFPTLLRAFASLRANRPCRLLILGEGRERRKLEALARELSCADDVRLPGYVDNPYAYLVRAKVFALSSAWEGLSNVLLEALACGCPVVSTDCPSGPREILAHGEFGPLVPVGDASALADAMLAVLDNPPKRGKLRARAGEFDIGEISREYLRVLLQR